MILNSWRVERLESHHDREALADLTFLEALERFAALWSLALVLDVDMGADWRHELEADLAVARALNGLPPRT